LDYCAWSLFVFGDLGLFKNRNFEFIYVIQLNEWTIWSYAMLVPREMETLKGQKVAFRFWNQEAYPKEREREREFETMIVESGFIEKKRRMNLLNDKLGKRRMIGAWFFLNPACLSQLQAIFTCHRKGLFYGYD
jgi:hypothetical protein